jgi:hypothetical protein
MRQGPAWHPGLVQCPASTATGASAPRPNGWTSGPLQGRWREPEQEKTSISAGFLSICQERRPASVWWRKLSVARWDRAVAAPPKRRFATTLEVRSATPVNRHADLVPGRRNRIVAASRAGTLLHALRCVLPAGGNSSQPVERRARHARRPRSHPIRFPARRTARYQYGTVLHLVLSPADFARRPGQPFSLRRCADCSRGFSAYSNSCFDPPKTRPRAAARG